MEDIAKHAVPAATLPEGWMWNHYDDGSGLLISPSGGEYFSYDLCTSEYIDPESRRYVFWKDYPEHMSLEDFTKFAEGYMFEHFIK